MHKTVFLGYTRCSYSVVKVCDTCDAIYHDKHFVLYTSTFCSMCAVPNMAGVSSSLMLCFPGMLLRYFLIIIIIIITTTTTTTQIYAGNLQLYIWNKPWSCNRSDYRTLFHFRVPSNSLLLAAGIVQYFFYPVRSQPVKTLFQISVALF
jgi:hypothetical protein